jgi:plastocyanin
MTGIISVRGADGVVPQTQAVAQEIPADATQVRIVTLSFDPAEVTIPTGTAVSWANDDTVPHTVTATDGAFDSGIFDPGASFSWTFEQPGSFGYICQLHPQMQGTVIVEGEAVAAAAPVAVATSEAEPNTEQPAGPTDAAVSIADFAFEPATLDIPPGAAVVWTNDGQVPHTVTGEFADSGILDPGQTFFHTFAEGGEFSYSCALHPDMVGTVRVSGNAAGESAQPATAAAGPDLEGVWLIELTADDDAILGGQRALATFHGDGTVDADFSGAPGAGTPASFLTSGRGEWVVQDAECGVALVALVNDANRRFAGTATLDAQGQLDETGRVLDGTFDFIMLSADGQTLGEGSGTIRGDLVPLEP